MTNYKPVDRKIIYLNTEANCTKQTVDSTNYSFTWYISDLRIDDLAHLRLGSFVSLGTAEDKILTFYLDKIQYNTRNYVNTINRYTPLLLATNLSRPVIGDISDLTITIEPQVINCITIICSNTVDNINAGISTGLKFIFGIIIDEFDIKYTQIGNPYGEARTNALNNRLY